MRLHGSVLATHFLVPVCWDYSFSYFSPRSHGGQFNPTSSTTFDNLEAGLPSGFSQQAFFAEGDEGPASLVVTFDRGSFSFNGYSPGQLVGGLVVDLFVPTPILTVQGFNHR